MILNLKLVRVDYKYCDYLRSYDNKVIYNNSSKETRPYIGILFTINDCEYFAPISSPKEKHIVMHNSRDFFKIDNGKLGAINFNNMIPVTEDNYTLLDLDKIVTTTEEVQYQILLRKQLIWLDNHYEQIRYKAQKLYDLYVNDKLPYVLKLRCCNFKLLEEKCRVYNKELVTS